MKEYNSLSNHLKTKITESNNVEINDRVDEGKIGDWFKSFFGKKGNEEKKGIFGMLGSIASMFSPENSENKLWQKYKDIEEKKLADEKTRLRDELKAEDEREIARLEAEYETNKTQLDLASQRRVEAYQATKRQLEDVKKREIAARKNKTALLYTREQNQARLDAIRNAGLDSDEGENPLRDMAELATIILCDKDGNPRSQEDIKAIMDKPEDQLSSEEKELRGQIQEYNEIAKAHEEDLITAMSSSSFEKLVKNNLGKTLTDKDADTQLENAKKAKADYEAEVEKAKKVRDFLKEQEKSGKVVEDAQKEVEKFTSKESNPWAGEGVTEDGKFNPLKPEAFKQAMVDMASDLDKFKKEDGSFDIGAYKKAMEDMGIPSETIDAFGEEIDGLWKPDSTKISEALNSLSDDQISEAAKKVAESKSKELADKKAAVADAKALAEESKSKKVDPEMQDLIDEYNGLSDEDKARLDPESEAGKKYKEDIEGNVTKAEKAVEDNKKVKKANKDARDRALAAKQSRKDAKMDPNLEDKVSDETSGIEAGEIKNEDGEVGFFNEKGKWVPKPSPNDTDEEKDEYIKKRDHHLLSADPEEMDLYKDDIESVKLNDDGKTYTITYKDKDKEPKTDASLDEAAKAKASQISRAKAKKGMIKRKQEVFDKVKKVFNEKGEFNEEGYNSLSDAEKETVKYMLSTGKPLHEFFKGMDIENGDDSANEIKKMFGDDPDAAKEKLTDALDTIESEDPDTNAEDYDETEWEDDNTQVDDEDSGKYDSEEDEEVDSEDSGKIDGEDVVKVDGKWYKKSDIDENGKPVDGAEEQDETKVTKDKVTRKKKLINPKIEWKRRKNKRTGKKTKSYYNVKDKKQSISKKEFLERVKTYQKAVRKAKQKEASSSSIDYTSLKNWLFEHLN